MKNNQSGFTLIEIVMVLVLLGILSAVAAPKYFDLQAVAEKRAAAAAVAEYQARVNAKFAQALLNGLSCTDARSAVFTTVTDSGITTLQGAETFGEWTLETASTGAAGGDAIAFTKIQRTGSAEDFKDDYTFTLPTCD